MMEQSSFLTCPASYLEAQETKCTCCGCNQRRCKHQQGNVVKVWCVRENGVSTAQSWASVRARPPSILRVRHTSPDQMHQKFPLTPPVWHGESSSGRIGLILALAVANLFSSICYILFKFRTHRWENTRLTSTAADFSSRQTALSSYEQPTS